MPAHVHKVQLFRHLPAHSPAHRLAAVVHHQHCRALPRQLRLAANRRQEDLGTMKTGFLNATTRRPSS